MNINTGTAPASTGTGMDAVLINALVNATREIFSTMANSQIEVKEIKPVADETPNGDISAVISIAGGSGEGMIALSFPTNLANIVVSRLLGMSPDQVPPEDRCDGIGELVNMISGNAKTILSRESGTHYQLSIPTIILGKGHEVYGSSKNSPQLLITFNAEGEEFYLQVSFKFKG